MSDPNTPPEFQEPAQALDYETSETRQERDLGSLDRQWLGRCCYIAAGVWMVVALGIATIPWFENPPDTLFFFSCIAAAFPALFGLVPFLSGKCIRDGGMISPWIATVWGILVCLPSPLLFYSGVRQLMGGRDPLFLLIVLAVTLLLTLTHAWLAYYGFRYLLFRGTRG